MRAVTATEKYRAVTEGKMAKKEFVRQMRREFPQYISQFNGYDDSVSILKNKGLIFETKPTGTQIYDERPAATVDLTRLERGIFYELQEAGLKPPFDVYNVTTEDYLKAAKKAKDNLIKNPTYYIDIVSGESPGVDKHDREVPVKRGELKKDVFNGLKKAEMNEAKKLLKEGKLEDLANRLGVPVDKLKAAADKIRDMERQSAQRDALKVAKMEDVLDEADPDEVGEQSFVRVAKGPNDVIDPADYVDIAHGYLKGFNKSYNLKDDDLENLGRKIVRSLYKGDIDKAKERFMEAFNTMYDDDENIEHDCASHVLHEKYGKGICIPEQHTLVKEGNKHVVTHYDVLFKEGKKVVKDVPVSELKIITESHHGHKRRKNEETHDSGLLDSVKRALANTKYRDIATNSNYDDIIIDFIKVTPRDEIMGRDGEKIENEFTEFISQNFMGLRRGISKQLPVNEDDLVAITDGHYAYIKGIIDILKTGEVPQDKAYRKEAIKALTSLLRNPSEMEELMGYTRRGEKEEEPRPSNYTKVKEAYSPGDMYSNDFDYGGMIRAAMAIPEVDPGKGASGEEVEHMRAISRSLEDVNYHTPNQDLMAAIDAFKEEDEEEGNKVLKMFKKNLVSYVKETVDEKKGKDHDGDGDVDSDDYLAAKDKAIKKAMGKDDEKNEQLKEAIKSIIKKSLNENNINEAATNHLAKLADTYGNYKGMQVILNDLQNIVTDIESYHAKTKEKLQNVFNKVGKVETEDGLSVGGFLAPAIESAFNKDSRHLGGNRLMKGVDMPKVQFLPKDIETPQNEESPKQTIFAPVKRYF